MERAVRMMQTGDFNPHFFDYPALYMYVQVIVAVCRFLFGAVRGQWPSLGERRRPATSTCGDARSRRCSAPPRSGWSISPGLRWGARTALLSAALLAVMPLHVRESHFVLTDVPVDVPRDADAFSCRCARTSGPRSAPFLAAAAAAGLAGATKYNGLLALVMPLIACAMTLSIKPSRWLVSLAIMATAALCFLLAVPYSVLDLPTFLNQFARLSTAYNLPTRPSHQFLDYLKHLKNAWHWPASLMVIGGLILGLVRAIKGPGRVKWTLLIVFPTLYMAFVSRQSLLYGRYLLPMVPFLSLLAAAAVVSGVSLLRRYEIPRQARSALIVALVLLAVAPPAYTSISYDVDAAKVWTTNQACDWIVREVPKGAKITVETGELQIPSGYRVDYVKQLRLARVEAYAAAGTDYLVASSQAYGPYVTNPRVAPTEDDDYVRLFQATREVARFTPSKAHPGPELRILKVNP